MEPESDRTTEDSERWIVTWEDVERAQLETVLTATPARRLAWLKEAMRHAHASGALEAAREGAKFGVGVLRNARSLRIGTQSGCDRSLHR